MNSPAREQRRPAVAVYTHASDAYTRWTARPLAEHTRRRSRPQKRVRTLWGFVWYMVPRAIFLNLSETGIVGIAATVAPMRQQLARLVDGIVRRERYGGEMGIEI